MLIKPRNWERRYAEIPRGYSSLGNTAIQTCNGYFSVSSVPVERRMEENM
jgi:hypothetical protein